MIPEELETDSVDMKVEAVVDVVVVDVYGTLGWEREAVPGAGRHTLPQAEESFTPHHLHCRHLQSSSSSSSYQQTGTKP